MTAKLCKVAIGGWSLQKISVGFPTIWPAGPKSLWRAVDQDGVVLDILVQPRRDANAAKGFFKRLLKGLQYVPRVIVTS